MNPNDDQGDDTPLVTDGKYAFMVDDIPKVFFHKSKSFEFEILPLARLFARNESLLCPLDRPHRTGFYQILYITKGEGHHYIDFKPYDYYPDSLIFISAGQVQAFDLTAKSKGFLLLFTEDFLTKDMVHSDIVSLSGLFNYHLYPPGIQPGDPPSMFKPIIDDIYTEYICDDAFAKEEILRTLVKLLMLKAERTKQTLRPKNKNPECLVRFTEFRHLVRERFAETRNAAAYAAMMNISYNQLNKIVKALTGKTAKSFIDSFIILEIKRQLAVSDMSVKEVTYITGFDEPTNFTKYFKKHTRTTPAQFRKNLTP